MNNNIKEIIVGFSRAKSEFKLGSKIIQLGEKRNYSHVYVKYQCPITGEILIAQASHGRVNIVNWNIFLEENIAVKEYKFAASDQQYEKVFLFICKNLGAPYGTMQLLFIAIKKLIHLEIPEYNKNKYFICSEFAAIICQILLIDISDREQDYITPSDLDTILMRNGLTWTTI